MKDQKNSFLYYILALIIIISVLPFLSSDPAYNVDNAYFCSVIAADENGGAYTLNVFSHGKNGEEYVFTGKGGSFSEAFSDAKKSCDGKLFYSTAELLVLGKGFEEKEARRQLALLSAGNTELQLSVFTVFTHTDATSLSADTLKRLSEKAESSELSYEARLMHVTESALAGAKLFPVRATLADRISITSSKEALV